MDVIKKFEDFSNEIKENISIDTPEKEINDDIDKKPNISIKKNKSPITITSWNKY